MVETDRLLYIDLHKTGCSHIRAVLQTTVGGRPIGKHNRPPRMPTDRFILGSIRNPWEWYVSLWAFGCLGKGAVHGRTTQRFTPWYYRKGLMAEMSQRRWRAGRVLRTMWSDASKPVGDWCEVYADAYDRGFFRRWLKLLLSQERRFDVGEGFGFSPMSRYAGLMTYRYVKLFSRDISSLFSRRCPSSAEELRDFDAHQNALDATVRMESLESDLLTALQRAGYELRPEYVQKVNAASSRKTNPSEHREAAYYYDEETLDLVEKREQLIIAKYGYERPEQFRR